MQNICHHHWLDDICLKWGKKTVLNLSNNIKAHPIIYLYRRYRKHIFDFKENKPTQEKLNTLQA